MGWVRRAGVLASFLIVMAAFAVSGIAGAAEPSGQAGPAESQIVAGPGATTAGYTTPAAATGGGAGLTFHNLDLPRHNVVASHDHHADGDEPWCEDFEDGHCPAFWSPLIGLGSSTSVQGVQDLELGTYEFYCTAHPWMTGTLAVGPQGVTVTAHEVSLAPHPNLEMVG